MTPTEAFNANLSQHSDSSVVRGKLSFTLPTTATPGLLINLYPNGPDFGQRVEAYQNIFTRYRFKSLKFKFLSPVSSAVGVQDDVTISGLAPTTTTGIAELRCSGTSLGGQTIPTEFEWKPLDPKRWFYTQTTASEPRTSYTGIVYVGSGSASTVSVEIDYVLVFSGATNIAAY